MARSRFLCLALVSIFLVALAQPARSMPNFARKAGMSCDGCHTTIPRLNETGFQFRKAGFRTPDEIGKDAGTSFKDTFTARIQARYDYNHRTDVSTKTSSNQLTFHEVTIYPLSGSFGKHYGSLTELSIAGEDFVEIENAYFRYTKGTEKSFWTFRGGIFHPFEGYGASDRPYAISRPLIQTTTSNQNGSTQFTPWNFDEAGLEVAYVHDRTSLSGTLFNGLFVTDDGGSFKAFPAAGGELQKPSTGFKSKDRKDIQLFANQILKEDGSGVSLYYYNGSIDLPYDSKMDPANFEPDSSFANKFSRGAAYGSWRLTPKLEAQAAYQIGQDHFYDATTASSSGTFKSKGWFAEIDAPVSDMATLGARYDMFDPSDKKIDNNKKSITAFANMPMNDGLQWIAQFQHIQSERAGKDDLKDNNFQLRMIWIF